MATPLRTERAADALRAVSFELGFTRYAEGSVLVKMGHTHVLCNASVLEQVPSFLKDANQGWLTAEYSMLPRATHTRSGREAVRGKQSGRTQEIQRLIGRSLRAAVDLQALGARTIHIDCDVLQADGGTRCASITGAWVAVAMAVAQLKQQQRIAVDQQVLIQQIAAVSVGLTQQQALLDLNYTEDAGCDVDVNVVCAHSLPSAAELQLVEVQGTAEERTFSRGQLNQLLDYAEQGIATLMQAQQQVLVQHSFSY